MPFYEYRCSSCSNVHTEQHSVADCMIDRICPECDSTATRIMSATKTTFKEADKSGLKRDG